MGKLPGMERIPAHHSRPGMRDNCGCLCNLRPKRTLEAVLRYPLRKTLVEKRRSSPMKAILALLLGTALTVAACNKASADVDPKAIEAKYGLSGGFVEEITTEEGKVQATIVPTTLDDGRVVQLVI